MVNIIILAIKYEGANFVSYLNKKSHDKTDEILGDDLAKSLLFEDKHHFWDFVIKKIVDKKNNNLKKICLEFGVGKGESIRYFADRFIKHNIEITGFDSFTGNPEIWPGTSNTIGSSNQDGHIPRNLPTNVKIIKGLIEKTLKNYIQENKSLKIDFIHIDVNIYSTTKYILQNTKKYLSKDTLIVFDELVNYPYWWKNGEFKALTEVFDKTEYEFIAFDKAKKAVIRIL